MEFAELLLKTRLDAGFSSPKHYYEHLGGQKSLGITYEYYYKIERGEILPKADKAVLLVRKSGVPDQQQALYSYVRDIMPDNLSKGMFYRPRQPEKSDQETYTKELEQTVAYYKSKTSHVLTEQEMQFVTRDREHMGIFLFFLLNHGVYGEESVAAALGSSVAKVGEIGSRMAELGMLTREGSGYRSVYHEADFSKCPNYATRYKKLVYEFDEQLSQGGNEMLNLRGWRLSNGEKMRQFLSEVRALFKKFSIATDMVKPENNNEAFCLGVRVGTRPGLAPKIPGNTMPVSKEKD